MMQISDTPAVKTAVSKIKATYGKEGEYCRFLEARGVERTLSEEVFCCTRKRQAKRPCLGTEEAAEDDGCSSSARMDNIGDESSTDSSNDSDSDSSSSGEDVNAQSLGMRGTGIILKLDIMEGKEANRRKEFSQEYGEGTAVTLRLTKEYYGTGRVVYAGSAK
eukprot:Em0016g941a